MSTYDRLKYRNEGFFKSLLGSESQRLKKVLSDYPAYALPHKDVSFNLSESQASENYEYFQQNKTARLETVSALLRDFSITIDTKQPEKGQLLELDAWAYQQWPAIFNETMAKNSSTRFQYEGSQLAIRSLLFDISLLLAECYLSLNSQAQWFFDNKPVSKEQERVSFNRLVLLLPPTETQADDWDNILDMEANVFYHYNAQKKTDMTIVADQRIGRVLAEPLMAFL